MPAKLPMESEYGVERTPSGIRINLGMVPAFEVPRATAIKLALLILRKCGVSVNVNATAQEEAAERPRLNS